MYRYNLLNKDVASSTSDVVKEKIDTDKKITKQDQELKQTEKSLNDLKSELQKTTQELDATEKKINSKTQEIQVFARSITKKSRGLGIFAAIVPFIGLIVKSFYNAVRDPQNVARMKALEAELNRLIAEKTALKQKQWQVQLKIIDGQMKVAKASFEQSESVFFMFIVYQYDKLCLRLCQDSSLVSDREQTCGLLKPLFPLCRFHTRPHPSKGCSE